MHAWPDAERVVLRLLALGEPGEAALGADGAEPLAAAGEQLVRVGLVADVEDEPVDAASEDVVQRDDELDRAERRAEVPAGLRAGRDDLVAELLAERAAGPRRVSRFRSSGESMPSSSRAIGSVYLLRETTKRASARSGSARGAERREQRERLGAGAPRRGGAPPPRPTSAGIVALPGRGVLAGALAERRGVAGEVEQVVGDLERERRA